MPVASGQTYTAEPLLRVVSAFANGDIHLYGDKPVHQTFHIPPTYKSDVRHIQIAPAAKRLLCLGMLSKLPLSSSLTLSRSRKQDGYLEPRRHGVGQTSRYGRST